MQLTPFIRPHVHSYPTLETAIWFQQLRWVAVTGQLLTLVFVAWGLKIALPIWELLALIGVTAATNMGYALWLRILWQRGLERSERLPTDQVVSTLMLVDIVVLTGMLYLSAGMANPFALFYFVNIAVAGAIIAPAWAWSVWATTVAGVMLLLIRSQSLVDLNSFNMLSADQTDPAVIWTIPKIGFFVSFATCGGVITYFITILTGELKQREQALKDAEDARIRNRQLEALTTLAAGAAHELASPLSTIAVVAKELSRALEKQSVPEAVSKDVALIRSELDRCRHILDRMTSTAGEAAGEKLQTISIEVFLNETLVGLREPERVVVEIAPEAREQVNLLPVQAAAQAIRNLLQNALDASGAESLVRLLAEPSPQGWKICVVDRGSGMTPEILQRIGEPFFTTKEPGRGMGLGMHLTQNVIRRLDGSLTFDSRPGQGTTATVVLPTLQD
ncbi:MAG: HAMP domain-containing histidine kinase [Planctomycetales bacterium]|nr:HAMP domain-containing histidine kinase [Planctomycetales bacterium]